MFRFSFINFWLTTVFLCNSDYFSTDLSADVIAPKEGDDITISCEIVSKKCNYSHENIAQWYKDGQDVKMTDRLYKYTNGIQHSLIIKNSNIYDSGNYSIHLKGRIKTLTLDVKGKFHILCIHQYHQYTLVNNLNLNQSF